MQASTPLRCCAGEAGVGGLLAERGDDALDVAGGPVSPWPPRSATIAASPPIARHPQESHSDETDITRNAGALLSEQGASRREALRLQG